MCSVYLSCSNEHKNHEKKITLKKKTAFENFITKMHLSLIDL